MGLSIYANATDELQNVDIAFNNFVKDFKLGGKKVFYDQSLVRRTENGAVITPDDMAQQLFLTVKSGNDLDGDKSLPLHEYNPTLRVDENTKGIQAALDYLSFKCGLGTRFYSFDGGTIQTATQYTGERQDLVQNANKHYIVVERALQNLVRGILYIGREFLGQPVDENCDIEIKFEDSYIIDKEQERERDRQDIRDGLMQKWEYRVKWYGESEEEAKAILGPTVDVTNPFDFKQQSGDNNAAT
jgi:A118 family predicted phage portal protein